MTQYSKRIVIIHWLTLALVIAAWFLGDMLAEATDDNKATLTGYVIHILVGGTILLLTLARIYFRRSDGTPPLLADSAINQTVAKTVHYTLYTLLILLPVSGIATLISSGAATALLSGNASLLPKEDDYKDLLALEVHETLVTVLIVLVVLHILGAVKHQFIMKDGLMNRMSWRKKS